MSLKRSVFSRIQNWKLTPVGRGEGSGILIGSRQLSPPPPEGRLELWDRVPYLEFLPPQPPFFKKNSFCCVVEDPYVPGVQEFWEWTDNTRAYTSVPVVYAHQEHFPPRPYISAFLFVSAVMS